MKMACVAADKHDRHTEIMFGSTLMRQHNFIFDVQSKKIGIARARCSDEEEFIISEQDFRDSGRDFSMKLSNLTDFDLAYRSCNHSGSKATPKFYVKNPDLP
mmetsp:Transcript_41864/g.64065  ORF Transcript_41864/g.64065 Transcript_41864/m.64065 type:complete len:102 (-) Transcript_41864:574-879(-)